MVVNIDPKIKKWAKTLSAIASIMLAIAIIWGLWAKAIAIKEGKPPAEARAEIPVYDFSSAIVPGEVKVPFRPDAWTGVTLPAAVVFRTDPSNDVEIVFIDGSRYIDGPGRQVWYGLKRGVFKIRGLTEVGVLKITLEKKTT